MRTYNEYKSRVESGLLSILPEPEKYASTIYEAMKYSIMNGGKRLRPCLLLASCDFAGGDTEEALPYACAVEYIHGYSLIHDDLPAMDNDDLRRGKPTNHKVFGEAMAILAGDGLLSSACEVMSRELLSHLGDGEALSRHAAAQYEIISAAGVHGMIAGQVADVENEFKDCDIELVDFIDRNKTGALLKAPIRAGLRLAGADEKLLVDFSEFADCLGKAFQISDDILDFTSTPEELGKSPGKDEEQGKCNYVLVAGMDAAVEKLHELTEHAVSVLEPYGGGAEFFCELARRLEVRKA